MRTMLKAAVVLATLAFASLFPVPTTGITAVDNSIGIVIGSTPAAACHGDCKCLRSCRGLVKTISDCRRECRSDHLGCNVGKPHAGEVCTKTSGPRARAQVRPGR